MIRYSVEYRFLRKEVISLMKKLICILLVLLMTAAILPQGAAAAPKEGETPVNPDAVRVTEEKEEIDGSQLVTFMVKLADSPVAASVKDVNSQRANDLASVLKIKQSKVRSAIERAFPAGVECNVKFTYNLLFNGFAIEAPYYMRESIAAVEGVEKVFIAARYSLPEADEAEDTRLSTSVGLINADDAWAAGYTGAGSVIAILDTGCVVAHNAFSTMPATQTMTTSKLSTVLGSNNLQAEQKYNGTLTASTLYYSGKIPFRFNYDNGTTNVAHSYAGSDHGSHVSGIVAGNYSGSSYTGVAKDAQLVIMEVFNQSTGAEWDVLLAAMEDCAYLEVDALNMSLGSDCGFTTDGDEVEYVYNLLSQHGVNVAVASGNSGSTSCQYYGSSYSYSLAMNPDNGLASTPGTYNGSLCVAASTKSSSAALCSFSSWGSTADLKIKPEITAPGDSIYAPVDSSTSGATTSYGSKSGTSMATPHIAGAMGIVAQYVKQTWPSLSLEEQAKMVDRLLMCTATPMMYSTGLPYSPRAQGAGLVDVYKAVTTQAYITVDGCDRPKLEIGDDKDKTGVFTMSFNIVNFGSTALTYSVTPYVESENAASTTLNGSSVYRMSCTPMNIKSNCSIACVSSVTVPANSTKTVTVTITLNDTVKNTLNTYYPHGAYVEGHIVLGGTTNLTVPFLGFFGNWNEASVFDRYTYIDQIKGVNNYNYMSKQIIVGAKKSSSTTMLFGANPYITTGDWLADRATLSPNGDGYYDKIDNVVLALIRNAANCGIKIYNEDDPDVVYYDEDVAHMPKTWGYSSAAYGDSYYYYATQWMDFTSWAPDGLAEGTHVVFKMYAYLDNPDFTPEQNECCEIVLPMTVDVTAPLVTYWSLQNGTLNVRVYDEHYAAWIGVYSDAACTNKIAEAAITETQRGAYTDLALAVGNYGTVYVKVGDYGYNTSAVYTLTGEGGSLEPAELTGISVSPGTTDMLIGQSAALALNREPAEEVSFTVEWSSSNEAVATVTGGKSGATVTAHAKGSAVITAVATDNETGAVCTDSAVVCVKNGYTYDYFEPTADVVTGEEYLIGFKSGNDVYLLMNYNPDPISSNNYYYSYNSNYYGYGIKAVTDAEGNVTGLDNSTYSSAQLINAEWYFEVNGSYYMIQSAYQSDYYLRVYSGSNYSDLYAGAGTSYATNWQWNAGTSRLSYYVSSSLTKYVSFEPTVGNYTGFFHAPTTASSVQLYKHTQGTVIVEDSYTVTFLDWDGTVLSVQEVDYGAAAQAPADPVREGYSFTGWDVDFSSVTSDLTVTAQYSIKSYRLVIYYRFADGTTAATTFTRTYNYGAEYFVESPAVEGYVPDIPVVEGIMGAAPVIITVTYTSELTGLIGDVNCDGTVNFADVTFLYMFLIGSDELTAQGLLNADVTQDGSLDFSDITVLYSMLIYA